MLQRFINDDSGADLIEYGLLCALIAIVGIVAWQTIVGAITGIYTNADTYNQNLSACTPDPGGGTVGC
jgi:Flp pilus assembly pilin Flp